MLDAWGAAERSHTEIARWVAAGADVEPLAWNAQAVAISYERADGFAITAQKTVEVAAEGQRRDWPRSRGSTARRPEQKGEEENS